MNRIFLVGYFIRNPEKQRFAKLLSDQNLYFLEASQKVKPQGNIIDFPQRLSGLRPTKITRYFFHKIEVDAFVKQLYRRDLHAYFSNLVNPQAPIRHESPILGRGMAFVFYCWSLFRRLYRQRRCRYGATASAGLAVRDFLQKFNVRKSLNFAVGREVRSFLLKFGFVAGYNYYIKTVAKLNPGEGDLFLNWGTQYSGNLLLESLLKNTGAITRVLEYGEITGTVSINKEGVFGASDVALNWGKFCDLPLVPQDRDEARTILRKLEWEAVSGNDENGMYHIYRNMFVLNPARKKVVYVNGSELIASGHRHNSHLIAQGLLNPNMMLLERACRAFSHEDYLIVYKDHPMTLRQSRSLQIAPQKFPHVVFANMLNMKAMLDFTDIVVTFPSKVVMTALMLRINTIVVGEFTIPGAQPEMGLFDESALENISEMKEFEHSVSEDNQLFVDFVARMLRHKLIKYDELLFSSMDSDQETAKLLKLACR